jgi:hypothetical protein
VQFTQNPKIQLAWLPLIGTQLETKTCCEEDAEPVLLVTVNVTL